MADTPASQKPRMVKKTETVREKAAKLAAEAEKSKKQSVLRLTGHYIAKPFKALGRVLAKIGRLKPFRILGRVLLPAYFRNSWKELKQVTWPKRREAWQLTTAVILFAAIFGVLISLVDFGLDKLFKQVLLK